MRECYKLSPSDLSFLWEDCPRCFYLKVKHGIKRHSIPMPSVFTKIHENLDHYSQNKRTEELIPELPPGQMILGEKWVQSEVIKIPAYQSTCYIKG